MKPVGIFLKSAPVVASRPAYTSIATSDMRIRRATPLEYLREAHSKKRLKGLKIQPKARSMPRVRASLGSEWPFSRRALRAGESVSELKADMTVEIAIVIANCL